MTPQGIITGLMCFTFPPSFSSASGCLELGRLIVPLLLWSIAQAAINDRAQLNDIEETLGWLAVAMEFVAFVLAAMSFKATSSKITT